MWFVLFLFWLLSCFGISAWAKSYNRGAGSWFLISFIFSPLVAAILLLASGDSGKKCPKCAEKVKPEAVKCKHCGYDFESQVKEKSITDNHVARSQPDLNQSISRNKLLVISAITVVALFCYIFIFGWHSPLSTL